MTVQKVISNEDRDPNRNLSYDEWIDINLSRIAKSNGDKVSFLNRDGRSANYPETDEIINTLQSKNLATANRFGGNLIDFGEDVTKAGGWIKWKELKLKEETENQKLNQKLKELQVENLEYQKIIRERNDKIAGLDLKLKRFQLLEKYWWILGIILTVIGWILYVL